MKVGFYQFRPQFGKIAANTKKIIKALDKLDADLIVLPELAYQVITLKMPRKRFHWPKIQIIRRI